MSYEHFFKIKNPTKADCLEALSKVPNDEQNGPDGELVLIKKLYASFPDSYKNDPDFNLSAIALNSLIIACVSDPTEEMKLKALDRNDWVISYMPEQSEEFLTKAISQQPCLVEFLSNPSDNLCLVAIKNNHKIFNFLPKKTSQNPHFCLAAIALNADIYPHIKICQSPDKETTIKNLTKLVEIDNNKKQVKNTIKSLEES